MLKLLQSPSNDSQLSWVPGLPPAKSTLCWYICILIPSAEAVWE